jgi:hypothetical protein
MLLIHDIDDDVIILFNDSIYFQYMIMWVDLRA